MTSYVRRALNMLLELYPGFDVIEVDWQRDGPWVLVVLGQPSETNGIAWVRSRDAFALHHFAIWKNTGAVHGIQHDGAVTDDPFLTVQ